MSKRGLRTTRIGSAGGADDVSGEILVDRKLQKLDADLASKREEVEGLQR